MKRWPALIGVLAVVAAGPALRNGFVYDDVQAIVENPLVHSLANSPRIWVSSYWPSGLLYRPLTIQLFTVEWWLGGGAPWVFHLGGLLLYTAVAGVLFRIARRLLPHAAGGGGAVAAGLVFAVHPVHVEVFANSVGQSELLATLFILIATDRYLAWRSPGAGGIASRRRGALVGLYLLAILSKETGYVLPALLLAVELLAVADRPPWRARIREIGPLFALLFLAAAAALLLRGLLFLDLKGEVTQLPLRGYGLGERAVVMLAALPQWVRLLVWPAHLQAHYGPPELPAMARLTPDHAIGIGLLALVSWAVIWSWRRAPLLALGLVWIAIALVPVSNLLTATGVFVAERTLFLPSAGFALAVGWGIAATRRRGTAPMVSAAATAILAVIVGLGLVRSMTRSEAWRTQDEFFARLTRDAPRSYRAQLIAGTYYLGARRFPEAERALGSARNLYQGDPAVYETYGQALRVQRRCAEALPIFEDGLTRHPDAVTLRARLIECALAVGDTARARRVAEDAVRRGQREFLSTLQRLAQP